MEITIENGKNINYEIVNKRSIEVFTTSKKVDHWITEEKCNKTINSITFDKNYTIAIGDELPVTMEDADTSLKSTYIVNHIEKTPMNSYMLIEELPLVSNYFLLPSIIEGDPKDYSIIGSFMNCYIGTELACKWKDDTGLLYVKYRFNPFNSFMELDRRLVGKSNFKDKIVQKRFIIYIFKIQECFLKDVFCYLSNEYYNISEAYAKRIIEVFSLDPVDKVYRLFFDRENLRKEMEESWGWNEVKKTRGTEIPLFEKPIKPILKDE